MGAIHKNETINKVGLVLLAFVAVLVLFNLLISKLAEMTLERATDVGKLEVKIDVITARLENSIIEANGVSEKLKVLQANTNEQIVKNEQAKKAIDELTDSIAGVSAGDSAKRLDTIKNLVSELGESNSSQMLLQLKDSLSAVQDNYIQGCMVEVDAKNGNCAPKERQSTSQMAVQKSGYTKRGGGYSSWSGWQIASAWDGAPWNCIRVRLNCK